MRMAYICVAGGCVNGDWRRVDAKVDNNMGRGRAAKAGVLIALAITNP